MTVQPGWYADPAEPTTQRYWDGEGWVGAALPVDATPPPGPPPEEPEEPEPPAAPASSGAGAPGSPAPGSPAAPGTPATPPPGAPGGPAAPWGGPPWGGPPVSAPPPGGTPPVSGAPPGGPPASGPPASGPPAPGPPVPPGWPGGPVPPGWPGAGPAGQPYPPGMPYGQPPPGWPQPYWAAPPPRPHGMELAPLGARVLARLIDISLVLLLNVVVNGWFVWRFVDEVGPVVREIFRRAFAGESTTENLPQASAQADGLQVVILLIAVALWFAYEVPSVANTGQTFGKRVMRIKVVPLAETEQLGFGRSFRRWNLLGLPVFLWSCCGIGFLIQLVDCALAFFDRPLRQSLHDKRGQTVVVRLPAPAASPAESTDIPNDRSGGPTS
ncbi:RDD family protein [Plantactinospora sp. WMMB782]|uniref:RDD family protein n=1 Tax=Plantactinospora sp. WMMB782 TaxID=3404121 RepID=UPI003B931066